MVSIANKLILLCIKYFLFIDDKLKKTAKCPDTPGVFLKIYCMFANSNDLRGVFFEC